jgi:hypothetical protein
MNEEILKKLGYNNIALEMMLKREAQISADDLIREEDIPGRKIKSPQSVSDQLNEISDKLIELKDLITNLPETVDSEAGYDEDFPIHKKWSLLTLQDLSDEIEKLNKIL